MSEYTVLESPYLDELENEVNNYIASGWEPLGGIAVKKGKDIFNVGTMKTEDPTLYCQAMIRKDD